MDIEKLITQKDQRLREVYELEKRKIDRLRLIDEERARRWGHARLGVEEVLNECAGKTGFSLRWIERSASGGRVELTRRTEFRLISLELSFRMDEVEYALDRINELVMTSSSDAASEDRFAELIDLPHLASKIEAAIVRAI